MRCFLVFISFLIYGGLLKADSASSSRISAVVNNSIISKADLLNRLRFAAISSGLEPTLENLDRIKPQMLRVMIDEKLQLEVGKKYNIEISKDHIKAAIKDIEGSNGMPEGSIAQMMNDNNIPFKTLEDQLKAQLIWLIYIQEKYPLKTLEEQVGKKHQDGVLPSLQIADWEIDQELKLQKEKGTKTQYHLAEIVLPCDRLDQEESVKNNLNQLIEELQKGAHFSALAQQFSGSATSVQGGDMGWLTEDQLEPEIKEALLLMQPEQLSVPIRTSQGYVIIAFIEQKLPDASEQSEEFSKEDIRALIANRKHSLLARRELRDLRQHAFIDVRM